MGALSVRAPAKINLFLHVLARRADGYHDIESLAVFTTQLADELTFQPAESLSLVVEGEFANPAGAGDSNLVMKAAQALKRSTGCMRGAQITLHKHIPVGAGLGGGSADAAATLRGLNDFWALGLNMAELKDLALPLGADVAMCLELAPVIARGIGEQLTPLRFPLPTIYAVLIHPRVPLLTRDVYAALGAIHAEEAWMDDVIDAEAFWARLQRTKNHLQPAAVAVNPAVEELLLALRSLTPTPVVARMTGSGACCFALYRIEEDAIRAAEMLATHHPHWWVRHDMIRVGRGAA